MRASLLLCCWLLVVPPTLAGIVCDGVDDDLRSGLALSQFMSASTGSMMVWYKPQGTPNGFSTTECFAGERLFGNFGVGEGSYMGIFRHLQLGGNERLCAFNWDGAEQFLETPFTNDVWYHLAWVHAGGNLSFYQDGALVGTTPSGNTEIMTGTFRICMGEASLEGYFTGEGVVVGAEVFATEVSAAEIRAKAAARLHHLGVSARTGAWRLDSCTPTADGATLFDVSGNGRSLTGDNGADDAGLTCQPNSVLTYGWGAD